jgi:hypothetical protein
LLAPNSTKTAQTFPVQVFSMSVRVGFCVLPCPVLLVVNFVKITSPSPRLGWAARRKASKARTTTHAKEKSGVDCAGGKQKKSFALLSRQ